MGASGQINAGRSRVFWVSAAILTLAFVADTGSTLAAGSEMLPHDFNPFVRGLSTEAYVAWSIVRLLAALAILTLFWPRRLLMREWILNGRKWLALVLPLSYRSIRSYILAALVLVIGPLKLVSASSNLFYLIIGRPLLREEPTLVIGVLLGVLTSNALLMWYHAVPNRGVSQGHCAREK